MSFYSLLIYTHGVSTMSLLISIIGILNMIISLIIPKEYKIRVLKIILLITILLFLVLDYSTMSLILYSTLIISLIGTYATNIFTMKILYTISNMIWLSFAIWIGSTEATIFEIIGFITLTIFYYKNRYNLKEYLYLKKKLIYP